MKILLMILLCFLLTGCGPVPAEPETLPSVPETTVLPRTEPTETTVPETEPPDPIGDILDGMTIDEKVGQLFLARCDSTTAIADIGTYHLGGFVLFGDDFDGQTPDSMQKKLNAYQAAARIPMLLAVDEEGGTVTRVSRYPAFRDTKFPSPGTLMMPAVWLRH